MAREGRQDGRNGGRVFALVKSVNDDYMPRESIARRVQWLHDQLLQLVWHAGITNRGIRLHCGCDFGPECGRKFTELACDCCHDQVNATALRIVARAEEAGTEYPALVASSRDSVTDRRLARSCRSVQPEYTVLLKTIDPFINLAENILPRAL